MELLYFLFFSLVDMTTNLVLGTLGALRTMCNLIFKTSQIQRQKVECSCQGLRGISIHWLQSFIGENGKDLNMDGEEICTTV